MSTGGIHVFGEVNPKSRNGSQRTMVMTTLLTLKGGRARGQPFRADLGRPASLLTRLCVFGVDDLCVFHVRTARAVRGLAALRSGRAVRRLVEMFRHRVR